MYAYSNDVMVEPIIIKEYPSKRNVVSGREIRLNIGRIFGGRFLECFDVRRLILSTKLGLSQIQQECGLLVLWRLDELYWWLPILRRQSVGLLQSLSNRGKRSESA